MIREGLALMKNSVRVDKLKLIQISKPTIEFLNMIYRHEILSDKLEKMLPLNQQQARKDSIENVKNLNQEFFLFQKNLLKHEDML